MLNLLNWEKPLKVNGTLYKNSAAAYTALKDYDGEITIQLNFKQNAKVLIQEGAQEKPADSKIDDTIYRIKVRQYMTKQWDFNDKWNNGQPMPMRVMVGKVLKETKGMVQMELWGKPMPTSCCMVCGRKLTHPVSLHYGIGPECGGHFHINPYNTEAELQQEYEALKAKMAEIKWTGWVVKSAIEEKEVIEDEGCQEEKTI